MAHSTEEIASLVNEWSAGNRGKRSAAELQLTAIPRQELVDVLVVLSDTQDKTLRHRTIECLSFIAPDLAVQVATRLLGSRDSADRWFACGVLHDLAGKDSVDALLVVLQADSEADIRSIAAAALGRIGDPRALPLLRRAAHNDFGADNEGRTVSEAAAEAIELIESSV